MHMKDWLLKLDDFLRMTEKDILSHSGKISHDKAIEKAMNEYKKHRDQLTINTLTPVEHHFLKAVKEIEQIDSGLN
ncbi:MAG: hypothetical protein KR126chlam5_01396 [Candidatus Anoxychlamydiales bacterium]|nr:hypothetical protein [Candidatus Anoxychlamydiales bacterium]